MSGCGTSMSLSAEAREVVFAEDRDLRPDLVAKPHGHLASGAEALAHSADRRRDAAADAEGEGLVRRRRRRRHHDQAHQEQSADHPLHGCSSPFARWHTRGHPGCPLYPLDDAAGHGVQERLRLGDGPAAAARRGARDGPHDQGRQPPLPPALRRAGRPGADERDDRGPPAQAEAPGRVRPDPPGAGRAVLRRAARGHRPGGNGLGGGARGVAGRRPGGRRTSGARSTTSPGKAWARLSAASPSASGASWRP